MIAARMAMRGTFAEPFELENFPVDCQDLRIIIMSTATSNKQVIVPHFRRDTFVTIDQEFTGLPEWKRHPPICDFILSDEKKSARGYRFSSMVLLIKVSRKSRCHLLRTACLIFLYLGIAIGRVCNRTGVRNFARSALHRVHFNVNCACFHVCRGGEAAKCALSYFAR